MCVRGCEPRSKCTGGSAIRVKKRGNESVEQLLKRFKKLCQREGLVRDMKRYSYYEKPSERRRRAMRKARRRALQLIVA